MWRLAKDGALLSHGPRQVPLHPPSPDPSSVAVSPCSCMRSCCDPSSVLKTTTCCLAGLQLVVSSHGPALHFLSTGEGFSMHQPAQASQQLLSLAELPMRCVGYLSETQVVAGGFDGKVQTLVCALGGAVSLFFHLYPVALTPSGVQVAWLLQSNCTMKQWALVQVHCAWLCRCFCVSRTARGHGRSRMN